MRISLIAIAVILVNLCYGQGGNNIFNLPEFLPPSPDVAALSKGSELSSTPHTGGANAQIPIYDLKVSGYSLPVNLNYSSNGYKPEEIPSRVGLSWSLNAGGAVTRIVRGKPDDYCTYPSTYLNEAQIQTPGSGVFSFLTDLENQASYSDSQPDEYRYNVNGLSGKFIIKRDGSILQLPYNNVKISVIKSLGAVTDITILDGNGIKYEFGAGMIEQTLEHNLVNDFINKQSITTAWMLTKITMTSGNFVSYTYGSINHYVQSGVMESVRKGVTGDYCPTQNGTTPCPVGVQTSTKTSLIRYSSRYLTLISANTGPSISISYQDRPDAGGDNRVSQILVSNGYGVYVKKVVFEYLDKHVSVSTPFNEGFFLKKVIIKDPTAVTPNEQVYELKYIDEVNSGAGATITMNIDHMGFVNGANNSTLLPANNSQSALFGSYGFANREPNGSYSKNSMLEKIIYPTGGYDEFHYEPNRATWWDSVNVTNIISARAMGVGASSSYPVYTIEFTPARSQVAEFYLSTSWMGSPPIPDGDPAPKTAIAKLIKVSTSEVVKLKTAYGFPGGAHHLIVGDATVSLEGGVTYRLELEARYGTENLSRADIVYDSGNDKEWKELNE